MCKGVSRVLLIAVIVLFPFLLQAATEKAPITGIGEFEVPSWFKVSFLDLKDDATGAAAEDKRLAVFFHQDGCPYCAALINTNFSQKRIVDYARKHFDFLEINMWGDREVIDSSGNKLSEKQYAAKLKVWFTPTLLFFNEKGQVVLRVNGYYPPHQFFAALKYVAERREADTRFPEYYAKLSPPSAAGKLHEEPFFVEPPFEFVNRKGAKPLAVFFEQKDCAECDVLHANTLKLPATQEQISRFKVFQLDRWSNAPVVTPTGKKTTAREWANKLNIAYVPAIVFFDDGAEVMRIEAMFKAFHVQSIMDYVASGAYQREPSFQRFISARADHLREQGIQVDLWK
jgi:thioredoxin-related protein